MALTGFANTPNVLRMGSAIVTTTPFSLSAWAVPGSFAFDRRIVTICASAGGVNQNEFFLGFASSTGVVQAAAADGSGSNRAASSVGATTGAWNHLGGVFASATDRRAFLNGGSKGTASTSKVPSGLNRTSIGLEDNSASDAAADGAVAHVAVYNVALLDAEMALLGKGISPLLVRRDALIAYWPLVGTGGTEASMYKNQPMSLVGSLSRVSGPAVIMPKRKLLLAA